MSVKHINKDVYTCDRCGFVFEKYSMPTGQGMHARRVDVWGIGLGGGVGGYLIDFDLCGVCESAHRKFMKGEAVPAAVKVTT